MILFEEAMSVYGWSHERVGRMHMEELRRRAFVRAQLRRVHGRAGTRIAATLRAWAERLDASERTLPGPWHEDVRHCGRRQRA